MKPLDTTSRSGATPVVLISAGALLVAGLGGGWWYSTAPRQPGPGALPAPAARAPPEPPRAVPFKSDAARRIDEGLEHARAGRFPDAVAAFDQALRLEPTNDEALYQRARARLQTRDAERAVEDVRAALISNPDRYEAYLLLDHLLLPKADFAAIIEAWSRYLARHPDDGRAWLERAGTHHHAGHAAEAQADLRQACALKVGEACQRLSP